MEVRVLTHKERVGIHAGVIGGILAVSGLFLYLINPEWRLGYTVSEGLALFLLIFAFVTHFASVKAFSTRRSTRFGANSILMVTIFVSILGIVNFLSTRHYMRIDLSEGGRFSLSPQTIHILKVLTRDVKINAFFQDVSQSKPQFKDLLESYRYYTPKLTYEFIDPDKQPAVAKRYGVTQYETVVVESSGQEATIRNLTEQELTAALIRVSREGKKQVSFVEGHGEHDLQDTDRFGYSLAKEALERQGFEVKKLLLLQEGKIPQEATVAVIAGPQRPFPKEEKEALGNYIRGGGQVIVLLDPQSPTELDDFLLQWGIQLRQDMVIDPFSRIFGGAFNIPIVNTYPQHQITQDFRLPTIFPVARSISFHKEKEAEFEFQPIAQTGQNSWAKRNLENENVQFNPREDEKGPVVVAAAISFKKGEGTEEKDPAQKGRIVIFGDSDFISNTYFRTAGNGDLFLNAVSWLAREEELISIRPKEPQTTTLLLTSAQGKFLFYFPVVILPSMILTVGIFVWRKRRRL